MEGRIGKLNQRRIEEKLKRRKDRQINKLLLESRIGTPISNHEQQPSLTVEEKEESRSL